MRNRTSFFVFFFFPCKEEKHETHKDAFWPVEENVVVVVVVVVVVLIIYLVEDNKQRVFVSLALSLSLSQIFFFVQLPEPTRKSPKNKRTREVTFDMDRVV